MPMLFDRLLDLPAVDYLDGAAGHSSYFAAQKLPPSLSATKHSVTKRVPSSKKATVAQTKKKSSHTKAQARRVTAKPVAHKTVTTKTGVIKPVAKPHTRTAPVKAGEIRSLTAERVGYDPAQGPASK